jgi:hypothetical protein
MSIGFATSTKYNSFPIIILLIIAHIFSVSKKERSFKKYFFDKKLIYSYLVIIGTFFLGSIGNLFYFDEFKQRLLKQIFYYQKGNILESTGMGPGWIGYFTQILPYSLTIPVQILLIISLIWALVKRRRWEIFLVIWTILYYYSMSNANFWLVRYTIPLIPPTVILIGHFIVEAPKRKLLKIISLVIFVIIVSISFANSIIFDSVRAAKDPRHAVYDWIRENIPPGKKIGLEITPAVFYNLTEDNENQMISVYSGESGIQIFFHNRFDASYNKYQPVVMKLNGDLIPQIDYYIANDQIYQHYMRVPNLFPVESHYFNKIFNSGQFQKVAEFENPLELFGWKFRKGYPPHDFMYFLPKVTVYKRIEPDTLK